MLPVIASVRVPFSRVGARRVFASLPPSSGASVGALGSMLENIDVEWSKSTHKGRSGMCEVLTSSPHTSEHVGGYALDPGHPQAPSGPNKHTGAP